MQSLEKTFFYKNKLPFAASALLIVLGNLLTVCYAWVLQLLLDAIGRAAGTGGVRDGLAGVTVCLVGVLAAVFVTQMLLKRVRCYFVKRAMLQYKNEAFRRITRKNITSFEREQTNTYLSVLTGDAATIEQNYLYGSLKIIGKTASFLGAFALMLWYHWQMTLIVLVLCVLPIVLAMKSGGKMAELELGISGSSEAFMGMLADLLGGFSVMKSFRAERQAERMFREENRKLEETKSRKKNAEGTIAAVSNEIGSAIQLGVFAIGGIFVVQGQFTVGVLLAFVQLMNNIMEPIQELPGLLANRKAARGLIQKTERCAAEHTVQTRGKKLSALREGIELRDVSFGYEEGKRALEHVSVTFERGRSYAVVGKSGSGKSTLLRLLLKGYDGYQGEICYDGIRLEELDGEALFDLVSVIQQNVFLFRGTILENITMFQEAAQEEVDRAVQISGLAELVRGRGYTYDCGEGGSGLSGGERQRVSIARALLKHASVLLMDEATAALDAATARAVLSQVLGLQDMLRIVVTHNLERESLMRFDEILVMRGGRLVERGTFEELTEKKGYFYSLCQVSQPETL